MNAVEEKNCNWLVPMPCNWKSISRTNYSSICIEAVLVLLSSLNIYQLTLFWKLALWQWCWSPFPCCFTFAALGAAISFPSMEGELLGWLADSPGIEPRLPDRQVRHLNHYIILHLHLYSTAIWTNTFFKTNTRKDRWSFCILWF